MLFQGSIGRTDFPMGNHQDLIDAITGRLWPLGDDTAFVPGHGPMSTFGHERRTNPFVADRVLARASRPELLPRAALLADCASATVRSTSPHAWPTMKWS